jgi:membrane-associated phospholipid phosphatase
MGCCRVGLLAALVISGGAQAQSVGHDLENAGKDITYVWSSPARLKFDVFPEIGAVLAATGLFMVVDEPLYNWLAAHPKSLPGTFLGFFREDRPLNRIGRSYVLLPTSAVLYSAAWVFDNPDLRQAGLGCISSELATTLSRSVINLVTGRLRPRFGKGAFNFSFTFPHTSWERRSFPGGHGSNIMTCVSFWNNRFDLGAAEPVLYAAALGGGWARVPEGAHWPSDTFFGQSYGWTIGKAVADRYLQRSNPSGGGLAGAAFGIEMRIGF